MMKHQIRILCAMGMTLFLCPCAAGFEVAPIDPIGNLQQTPDVDNGIVVWAEQVEEEDWDVYGLDLFDPGSGLISVAAYIGSNQDKPAIWNNRVVFQEDIDGDWDVYVSDISDANLPVDYLLTRTEEYFLNDQIEPAVHGNTAVWQSYVVIDDGQGGTIEDWDIYAADITDPNNAFVYVVDEFASDQQQPAVYRSTVVYQDHFNDNADIWSADVWLKDAPQYQSVIADDTLNQAAPAVWDDIVAYERQTAAGDFDIYARDMSVPASEPFLISGGTGLQQSPDISGHLVVWQDDRNGNWDIYGYNLITRQEFQITTDGANQPHPAISGLLVAWEDSRDTPTNIYYTWLDGDVIADCPNPLAGDVDGDCRVNLADFVRMAEGWLVCALEPATACSS